MVTHLVDIKVRFQKPLGTVSGEDGHANHVSFSP